MPLETVSAANIDFVRITSYVNERHGVIVCRDTETGYAVASVSIRVIVGVFDYQGNSKKFILGAGQTLR